MREGDVARRNDQRSRGAGARRQRPPRPRTTRDWSQFTQPVLETRLRRTEIPEQMRASGAPAKIGEITVCDVRATARGAAAAACC